MKKVYNLGPRLMTAYIFYQLAENSLRCQIDNSTLTYDIKPLATNGIVSLVIVLTPDR